MVTRFLNISYFNYSTFLPVMLVLPCVRLRPVRSIKCSDHTELNCKSQEFRACVRPTNPQNKSGPCVSECMLSFFLFSQPLQQLFSYLSGVHAITLSMTVQFRRLLSNSCYTYDIHVSYGDCQYVLSLQASHVTSSSFFCMVGPR